MLAFSFYAVQWGQEPMNVIFSYEILWLSDLYKINIFDFLRQMPVKLEKWAFSFNFNSLSFKYKCCLNKYTYPY